MCGTITPSAGKSVRVCSTHLESGKPDVKEVLEAVDVRRRQASELAKHLKSYDADLLVLGGDMNSPLRGVDPTRLAYEWGGFHDVHDSMPWADRGTAPDEAKGKVSVPLDMIYVDKKDVGGNVGVCSDDACVGWSDHVPIYAELDI